MVSVRRVLRAVLRFRALDQVADTRVETVQIADHAQADAVRVQLADLALQRGDEQAHQERHFVVRTAPVFRTEGEQRQVFDALPGARLDGRAHRVDTARMARHARQAPLGGPTAVAIHDDRDMSRHRGDIRHAHG